MDFGRGILLFSVLLILANSSSAIAHPHNSTTESEVIVDCYNVLNGSSESIYSPDYPNAAPVNSKCTWELNAPPGKHVAIIQSIDGINVGGTDWDCTMGYLEIYDGCGKDMFLVDKICFSRYQNNQQYLWVSTGRCLTVRFNSAGGTKNKFSLNSRHTSTSCNKVFHGSSNGTFSGPVSSPSEQKECTWIVTVLRNKVELQFLQEFQITGNNMACKENVLTVQDGKFSSSEVLGVFCGPTRPYPVYSSLNSMRITFKSNGALDSSNMFTAMFKMVDRQPAIPSNYCNSAIMMNKPHGTFFSPQYPQQYPARLKCVWLIQVKQDFKILLRFKDFDVEGDSEKCQDYVEIYDGLASWSPIKGRYCGRNMPPVFRSESNKLRIKFTTDTRKYAGRGFEAVYSDFDPKKAEPASSSNHFTGIMIGTTCGIIFIVLSVLAVFHARKRRRRRALEQRAGMGSTISFDVHQANAPPSYETVMASPNMYPTPKVEAEHNRAHTYESLPKLHHEVCHLLGNNQDSDEEEPPPTYHVLFGDENDVHAYRPIGGQFAVEYHRNASQGDQAGGIAHSYREKPEGESKPGRVWQRRDTDESHSSFHLPGSRTEATGLPKDEARRPMLERQDTCSSFVTDV